MRSFFLKSTAIISFILSDTHASAQGLDSAALMKVEHRRLEATLAGDTATLKKILATEFVITRPSGVTLSKQQYISDIGSGALRYHKIAHDGVALHMSGATAVLTGRASGEWTDSSGEHSGQTRFTHVFARIQHEWKVVAIHVSRIP